MCVCKMKCIYMFVSPSNKVYIGKTVRLKSRLRQHKHCASNKSKTTYLYNAIRKYGWENFTKVILEIFADDVTKEVMSERERYYILKHEAFGKHGYNLTEGGEGAPGYKHSKAAKKKLQSLVRERGSMKKLLATDVITGVEYVFESRAEATRQLTKMTGKKISRFHITDCCKGVQKTHQGFIFKYI